MNPAQFGLVSSIFTLGGLLGAIGAGLIATHYGRLLAMRLTTIFFIIGPLSSAIAPAIWIMAVGRFISGLGAGAAIVVVPIYISEVAPVRAKGLFGASTQVMINMGILMAQLLGYFLSYDNMWRIVLAAAGGLGTLQCLGLFIVPESPEWLAANGRTPQALRIIAKIKHGGATEENVGAWGTAAEGHEEEEGLLTPQSTNAAAEHTSSSKQTSDTNTANPIGILRVVVHPHHYRAIIAVVGVMLAQQLCGINSIVMYSVSILSTLLPTTAGLITVAVGALNLVVTIVCAPLADKLGRKTCLLLSIAGMGTNAFLLAVGIIYSVKILSTIATLLFVASFAVGLGPVPFILANELVGPEAVGATQSWALAANWIATFVVAQFFPILNRYLGKGKVYFVFTGLALVFFVFVAIWVPETKGKKHADEVWGREGREGRERLD